MLIQLPGMPSVNLKCQPPYLLYPSTEIQLTPTPTLVPHSILRSLSLNCAKVESLPIFMITAATSRVNDKRSLATILAFDSDPAANGLAGVAVPNVGFGLGAEIVMTLRHCPPISARPT